MIRLLINAVDGRQDVIEVEESGGYFDQSRVLWDERIDGPLPEITLGGMVRQGDALVFDQARMDEHLMACAPAVPDAIDPLQGLLVLDQAGYSSAYEAWANDPARTFAERAFIQRAKVWKRSDPLLQGAAAALGISAAELDALFVQAGPP